MVLLGVLSEVDGKRDLLVLRIIKGIMGDPRIEAPSLVNSVVKAVDNGRGYKRWRAQWEISGAGGVVFFPLPFPLPRPI